DHADPYQVYGGAQDNGVWVGPSDYTASTDWHQSGKYPYESLLGGDGMQVAVDTRDNQTVYTGFQFGNYFRIDRRSGRRKPISPRHELGERPYRFNWQTPIWLSKHNQDILYLGAQKLFRSFDRGDNWEAISGDLTGGGAKGNVPFGTLTAVHESPLRFGLLYTGSDDGQVHVSRDGGENWQNITAGLPEKLWVSSLRASAHEKGRVYLALNGYRRDNFNAYIYRSDDFGQHWTRIGADLPTEPVNALREDPLNPDLLYVGTDHGVYFSLDQGQSFQRLSDSLPAAPVHDLVVHPTAADLIVGSHGRSMFKISVKQLQQLSQSILEKPLHVFESGKLKYNRNWGRKSNWSEPREPATPVQFFTQTPGKISWVVKTVDGLALNSGERDCVAGLNSFNFVPDFQEKQLKPYLKTLNEGQKDPKIMIDLSKAENGKYYL
ncbi:MAG: glycosyl hydrolase, partial [Saprospiraceae bacterium]